MYKNWIFSNREVSVVLLVFGIVYVLTMPQNWISTDSFSYFNQAEAISQGRYTKVWRDLIDNSEYSIWGYQYTLGNAHWLSVFIFLFGKSLVFIGSLVACLATIFFTYKTLDTNKWSLIGWCFLFLYLPFQFYAKTIMTGVPSLMLASLFFYFLFKWKDTGQKWFWLCFIASFSFWFRESNIILLGVLCFTHFIIQRKFFLFYVLGTLLGFIPRLITAWLAYGDPFHYRLTVPFQVEAIADNYLVYFVLLMLFFPGGLFFLLKYGGRFYTEIIVSSLIFIVFYLSYAYTCVPVSGFTRGVLLTGRFMLPLIPVIVVCSGYFFRDKTMSRSLIIGLICCFTICCQLGIYFFLTKRENAAIEMVRRLSKDKFMFYDKSQGTNIIRYINPLSVDIKQSSNLINIVDTNYVDKVLNSQDGNVIFLTENMANDFKKNTSERIMKYLEDAVKYYAINPVDSLAIEQNLTLKAYSISRK